MVKHDIEYQNNPFFIGLNGLQLLFKRAQSVGIYAAILAGIAFLLNTVSNFVDFINEMNKPEYSPNVHITEPSTTAMSNFDLGILVAVLAIVLVMAVIAMLISALLYGVLEYTSAQLARDKHVALGDAFAATF